MAISQTGSAEAGGSATDASITHGLTINENDLVVGIISRNQSGSTIGLQDATGGATWTSEEEQQGPGSSRHAIQYVIANSSEPATYTFPLGAGVNDRYSVHIRVFSGVDTASPVDVASLNNTGNSASVVASALTVAAGSVAIAAGHRDSGSGSFDSVDNSYLDVLSTSNQRQGSAYRIFTSAGSTGDTSLTMSASGSYESEHIAFAEAAAGGATPHGPLSLPFSGPLRGPFG